MGGLQAANVVRTRVPWTGASNVFMWGSGYVIDVGLVLTAAHVLRTKDSATVERGQQCEVRPRGSGAWLPGLVWAVDQELDVALVNCSAYGSVSPVSWGRLTGADPLEWQCVGFPVASIVEDDELGRLSEEVGGRLWPVGMGESPKGELALTIESRTTRGLDLGRSGWAGLSGSAVFCRDHLVGIVLADPDRYAKSLVARRAEHILASAEINRFLAGAPRIEDVRGEPPAPAERPSAAATATIADPYRTATAPLREAGRSRVPIVVALDTDADRLDDAALPRDERHLTVTLGPGQVAVLTQLAGKASAAESIETIEAAGRDIWAELYRAQPRLATLLASVMKMGVSQPVAWCASPSLLARIGPAILLTHTGGSGAEGFMTLAGAHYFTPVPQAHDKRRIARRAARGAPQVAGVVVQDDPAQAEADLRRACTAPVAVLLERTAGQRSVELLAGAVHGSAGGATRAAVVLAASAPEPARIDRLLDSLPFLSFGESVLARPGLLPAIESAFREYAAGFSPACIVSAVRGAAIRTAIEERQVAACLAGLRWSSWSWIGLPLLAEGYHEVPAAAFPHLMQLRSVASRDWYYNRHKGILDWYAADSLVRATDSEPGTQRFHLYLSGAGGTGKSCFLRYVHDEIATRPAAVAVWYRVDAPNSQWEDVEQRIRAETVEAVRRHPAFGAAVAEEVARIAGRLGPFLRDAAQVLKGHRSGFAEIVLFVDQLERTFESSGDQPEDHRLQEIAEGVAELLRTVGVGTGVRVFLASRKQYLPDFLRSTRRAEEIKLEFNVLQTISDSSEQLGFIDRVLGWCHANELVERTFSIDRQAAARLGSKVDGHPLNLMLALIELLSMDLPGVVTERDLDGHRPWDRLFALDLDAVARDDLDWYFVLAMAHARTEIVRFEEVWWRLRMVDSRLTRRVDDLQPAGVIERLWLLGHLGRTLHLRPDRDDQAGFVEFFHANLRDYLLRNVLAPGGADIGGRGRRGTPPAWRALDRLAARARDWQQTQQLLGPDDLRVLMEHRDQVIAPPLHDQAGQRRFQLLFLTDRPDERGLLCDSAAECFVFSALVHDDLGSWAFAQLFPDISARVKLCRGWLGRCSETSRPPLLRYLLGLEIDAARAALVDVVLDERPPEEDLAPALAAILAEPLSAARFRNAFVAELLQVAVRDQPRRARTIPQRVKSFLVTACGGDRDALAGLLGHCEDLLGGDEHGAGADVVAALRAERLDDWLRSSSEDSAFAGAVQPAAGGAADAGLVVGRELAEVVDEARLAAWSAELRRRLGVPFPELRLIRGEVGGDELELRARTGRIASNRFRPGRMLVPCRDWEAAGRATPPGTLSCYGIHGDGDALWLLEADAGPLPSSARDFDGAVLAWLERHARRAFDLMFDIDQLILLLRDVVAGSGDRGRLHRLQVADLRRMLVLLVREGVPLGPGSVALQNVFSELTSGEGQPEFVAQKVRESVGGDICRAIAGESGHITVLLLDTGLEQQLADRTLVGGEGSVLTLEPAQARRVAAAVQRSVSGVLERGGSPPAVVTDPALRHPLARLLREFDVEVPVLSFTELVPDVVALPGDLVGAPDLLTPP